MTPEPAKWSEKSAKSPWRKSRRTIGAGSSSFVIRRAFDVIGAAALLGTITAGRRSKMAQSL
jgi:hypothetical protein